MPVSYSIPPPRPPVAPKPLPPLDLKLLADLPSLELRARYFVDGFFKGKHRSPRKGTSIEFAEYRNYQWGDDPRRIDWRLFGRTERLHVRQYEEETQLRIFLLLDTSASMNFTSRPEAMSKIDFARLVAAGLGSLARRQGDSFGLGLAGGQLKDFLRASSSISHWKTFIGRLDAVQPTGPTALAQVMEALAEAIPRRSIVFVISDFYEESAPLWAALRRLRYDHHETVGIQVLDPFELDFDLEKSGTFVDLETGLQLKLDSPAVRDGYLKRFRQFNANLNDMFHSAGGELVQLRTDESPMAALTQYVAIRSQRLK